MIPRTKSPYFFIGIAITYFFVRIPNPAFSAITINTTTVSGRIVFPDTSGAYAHVKFTNVSNPEEIYEIDTQPDGTFTFQISETNVNDGPVSGPESIAVYQNYPNPVGDETTIQFYTAVSGDVIVTVFNLMGQEVDNKIYSMMPGAHTIGYRPKGGAGVQFYRITQPDGKTQVKKIVTIDSFVNGGLSEQEIGAGSVGKVLVKTNIPNEVKTFRVDITSPNHNFHDRTVDNVVIENDIDLGNYFVDEILNGSEQLSLNFDEGSSGSAPLDYSSPTGIQDYTLQDLNELLNTEILGDTLLNVIPVNGDVNGNFQGNLKIDLNKGTVYFVPMNVVVNPMTDIPIRTFDVQYLKERMAGTVEGIPSSIMIGGKIYNTDENGLLNIQVSPADSIEVKVSTTKDNNPDSFASPFWVPVSVDFDKMLNIPVVSYNKMSYNTDIPISPQTMKDFAGEGVFNPQGGAWYYGLKGFDWKNRNYKEWIDAGQLEKQWLMLFKTYTPEQQQQVSQNIVQLQHPSFVQDDYKPEIQIASAQDTLPYYKDGQGRIFPARGIFWIAPRKLAPQMGFAGYDYDNDGILDAGEIYITYFDNPHAQEVEYKSKFVIGPINSEAMRDKTLFHQKSSTLEQTAHDTRLINMTQLLHTEPFAIREIGGELYLGYKPKTDIDRILQIPQ